MLKIKRARPKAMFMGPVTLVRCDYTNPNQKICGTLFWQISILTLCISRSQPKWSNSKIAGRRFSSDPVFWYTWNSETYSVAIFRKDCALSVCWSLNKFWKILILIIFWAFYEKVFGMLTRSNSTLFYGYDPKYGLVRFGSTVKKYVEMKSPRAYR